MSDGFPLGEDSPFGEIPFLADFLRLVQSQGPLNWDAARQVAFSLATGGSSEPNVDPVRRIEIEQLARVAELHVARLTGRELSATGRPVQVLASSRTIWVDRSLGAYRPIIDGLATTMTAPEQVSGDPQVAGLFAAMTPLLLSFTTGGLVGHLARRALGTYDLPIPRDTGELLLVVPNLDEFEADWSLSHVDVAMWMCLHELLHHSVLGTRHVADRILGLLKEYTSGFESDPAVLEERLSSLGLDGVPDLARLQEAFGDPDVVLGAVQSDRQRQVGARLAAVTAAVVGWVDYQLDQVGASLISTYDQITEAQRRRRVEADRSDRFVERLLGLEMTQAQYDRGRAFIDGVVDRADADALARLWTDPEALPTPAEVDAPGLWLARIDL